MEKSKPKLRDRNYQEIQSFAIYKARKLGYRPPQDAGPLSKFESIKNDVIKKINLPNHADDLKPYTDNSPEVIMESLFDEVQRLMATGIEEDQATKDAMANWGTSKFSPTSPFKSNLPDDPYSTPFFGSSNYMNSFGMESLNGSKIGGTYNSTLPPLPPLDDYTKELAKLGSSYSLPSWPPKLDDYGLDSEYLGFNTKFTLEEFYSKSGEIVGLCYTMFSMIGVVIGSLSGYFADYKLTSVFVGIFVGFLMGIGCGFSTNAILLILAKQKRNS